MTKENNTREAMRVHRSLLNENWGVPKDESSFMQKELIQAIIEEIGGRRKDRHTLKKGRFFDERYERAREYEIWKSGYNQALSDLKQTLMETINKEEK